MLVPLWFLGDKEHASESLNVQKEHEDIMFYADSEVNTHITNDSGILSL